MFCLGSGSFHLLLSTLGQGNIKSNLLLKVAGTQAGKKNACRNLSRLIKRTPGTILPIKIDVCDIQIRMRKPLRCCRVYWPMIRLEEWCRYFLQHKPQLMLAGHGVSGSWKNTFRQFWRDYQATNPTHPIYSHFAEDPDFDTGNCIPYFIHGDEGRGHLRRPFMVLSFQFAIGHQGVGVVNDSTNLFGPIEYIWFGPSKRM